MSRIPVVLTPDVSFPFVEVYVPYPNSTPGQVLEVDCKTGGGSAQHASQRAETVNRARATMARLSASVVDWGANTDMILADVREKVDGIRGELPTDVQRVNIGTLEHERRTDHRRPVLVEARPSQRLRSSRRKSEEADGTHTRVSPRCSCTARRGGKSMYTSVWMTYAGIASTWTRYSGGWTARI